MDYQTPDEVEAHFQGLVRVVFTWLAAVNEDNWSGAWQLSDDAFRLFRAQNWLWANREKAGFAGRDLASLAGELAADGTNHELWSQFADLEVASHRDAWSRFNLRAMGAGTRPRPVDLDYEIVVLAQGGEAPVLITERTALDAIPFLVHLVADRWLVANAGSDQRLEPGWPPVLR